MDKLHDIAEQAEVIVDGFAFGRGQYGIRVFNLNNGKGAAELLPDGTLIETNMDEIELAIICTLLQNALRNACMCMQATKN